MTQHNQHKPTPLDDLAAMIHEGFTQTQKHMDQRLDGMEGRLDTMADVLKDMAGERTATHEDVRYLRRRVDLLVRNDAAQDAAINTLAARVTRLEKNIGLVN